MSKIQKRCSNNLLEQNLRFKTKMIKNDLKFSKENSIKMVKT